MGRPKRARRAITCSFSIPPELQKKVEYIHMTIGLSAWVQDMLSKLPYDEVLTTQYTTIKKIIVAKNLYIRHVGIEDIFPNNIHYSFLVKGLGASKSHRIAIEVIPHHNDELNIKARYELLNDALQEIISAGFDASWI